MTCRHDSAGRMLRLQVAVIQTGGSAPVRYAHYDSPIGSLLVAGDRDRLDLIAFPEGSRARTADPEWTADRGPFSDVFRQLDAYFAGDLQAFDLPLHPAGTEFQQTVWHELVRIPYGETISYGALARRIGRPKASRAVGAANGANPIPIVIPCHRVVGSDRSLTGFGGGLDLKRWLLNHEFAGPKGPEGQANLFQLR